MNELYIYHHLGLGDHIICNGLVRHYATLYDKIHVFCKPHNIQNVCYMFRDNQNIKIISSSNKQAESFISNKQNNYLILRTIGDFNTFDKAFYSSALIPFEYKWDKFYFKRDTEKESYVFYDIFGLKDQEEFMFIHDDLEREFSITKQVQQDIKIIKPKVIRGINLFDYLYVIEKAKEVHCIDSAFFNLIDCIQLKKEGLFFHKYVRLKTSSEKGTPCFKMDWKVIN